MRRNRTSISGRGFRYGVDCHLGSSYELSVLICQVLVSSHSLSSQSMLLWLPVTEFQCSSHCMVIDLIAAEIVLAHLLNDLSILSRQPFSTASELYVKPRVPVLTLYIISGSKSPLPSLSSPDCTSSQLPSSLLYQLYRFELWITLSQAFPYGVYGF